MQMRGLGHRLYDLEAPPVLQRWNARGGGFISVKGNGVALSVGPQGLPWLVAADGQILSSGLFALNSKSINTAACAQKFFAVDPAKRDVRIGHRTRWVQQIRDQPAQPLPRTRIKARALLPSA